MRVAIQLSALAMLLALGQAPATAAEPETAIAAGRGEAERLWQKGREAADSGQLDRAVGFYQRSLAIEPARLGVLADLALAWSGLERWDEARRAFEQVLRATPRDADALNGLGYVHYRQKRVEQAIACYRRAIAAKPDPQFHLNLGLALMAQERYGDAEREFATTVALDPRHYWGHNNLGYAREKQGRSGEAAADYRRAIELGGDQLTAHLNYGNLLVDARDYPGAAWVYRDALKRDDGGYEAHWGFGLALLRLGRLDEAYLETRVALALGAPAGPMNALLCSIHERRGELMLAIEAEKRAIAAADSPRYQRHLAWLCERAGRLDEAAVAYEAYLKAEPEGEAAKDARWRLRTLREVLAR